MEPLDPQIAAALEWQRVNPGPTMETTGLDVMRVAYDEAADLLDPNPPAMRAIEARELVGGPRPIAGRLFTPHDCVDSEALLVWLHGGGWVQGGLRSHDAAYRRLAASSGIRVLGVEYSLSPEFPFPAGLLDVEASMQWVLDHHLDLNADPTKIGLGGDSSGASLALVAGLELAREGSKLAMQVLLYPSLGPELKTDSLHDFGDGYGLTAKQMEQFFRYYLVPGQNHADPRVSPLLTPDFHEAPLTVIAVAGYDPLRDEGLALSGLLEGSGVRVELIDEVTLTHGFLRMSGISDAARDAVEHVGAAIRRNLVGR